MNRTEVLPWSIACDASLNLHFAAARDCDLNDHPPRCFARAYHTQYGFAAVGIAIGAFQQNLNRHECLSVGRKERSHHDTFVAAIPARALTRTKEFVTYRSLAMGTDLICPRRSAVAW